MDLTEDIETKRLKHNINNLSIISRSIGMRLPSLSLFSGIKFPLTSMYFSIKFYTIQCILKIAVISLYSLIISTNPDIPHQTI